MIRYFRRWAAFFVLCLAVSTAAAQTTEFTYQGKLNDGGVPANASYDMQFKLFDAAANGGQVGWTVTVEGVQVVNGIFTVQLDFGPAFGGADRFLEVGLKPAGSANPYTSLAPRQAVTSAPYSIRSMRSQAAAVADLAVNSQQLGGLAADQYVLTGDPRLTDSRMPLPGSANYIQNSANAQVANFNITGNGTLNRLNATSGFISIFSAEIVGADRYDMNGASALMINAEKLNTFLGRDIGWSVTGIRNTFVGSLAGYLTNTGSYNTFVGVSAGRRNETGERNAFFGAGAGEFGMASFNSFFGNEAGLNSSGNANSFFGMQAGSTNITGSKNAFFGYRAQGGLGDLTNATAIGANAFVTQNNSLVLGAIDGVNGATASTNVGIGTTAPANRFNVVGDSSFVGNVGIGTNNPAAALDIFVNGGTIQLGNAGCSAGFNGIGFSGSFTNCTNYSLLGNGTETIINRPTGGSIYFREENVDQMRIVPGGGVQIVSGLSVGTGISVAGSISAGNSVQAAQFVGVGVLSSNGATQLCRNNVTNFLSTCSSSIRYKKDLQPFTGGLDVINRLRPVAYRWKNDGSQDLGFVAEEVADIEPLLVTYSNGEVEGLKYDRLSTVFVNAFKEQQAQIEAQQKVIERQQQQIDALVRLVCESNPAAAICREEKK